MDIANIITLPFGLLMKLCCNLLGSYGWAIVLFTFITKIILLPLSVWVHKNSIKMVKMQPEINWLKVNFFGDKDRIAEGEAELYKKHKYNPLASVIPLFVQIGLLLCVVQVIYNPLTYILDVPEELSDEMIRVTAEITDADAGSSSVQLSVVNTVQNKQYTEEFAALQNKFGNING